MRSTLKPEPASAFGLAIVKRQTLHDDVYQQLRQAIISGVIKPGEMLSHRSMAKALGTSVMPVRDAVCRLVAEQALVVYPNRAIGLPLLTHDRFSEICNIREALEGLAAFEAARRIKPATLTALRRLCAEMSKARDYAAYMQKNQQFHFMIYHAAEMPFLTALIEMLWLQIGPLFNYIGRLGGGSEIPDRHTDAVDALARRDPEGSRLAIEADIEGTRAFLAGMLDGANGLHRRRSADTPRPQISNAPDETARPRNVIPRKGRRTVTSS